MGRTKKENGLSYMTSRPAEETELKQKEEVMLSRRILCTIREGAFCLNVNLDEGRLDFNGLLRLGEELSNKLVPELISNIIEKVQIYMFNRYLGNA